MFLISNTIYTPSFVTCHFPIYSSVIYCWSGFMYIKNINKKKELRLLKDAQPEPFINQSGPFLSNGVTRTRWTSGRPL